MDFNTEILTSLALTTIFFLVVLGVAVVIEDFFKPPPPLPFSPQKGRKLLYNLVVWMLFVFPVTMTLNLACETATKAMGYNFPKQELISILQSPMLETLTKITVLTFIVISQPLLEEVIFRRYLFRNLLRFKTINPAIAIIISGVLFAAIHGKALIFLPLCFFGSAIAWLYYRTGTILAPITAHCCFNLVNAILLFLTPK